MESKKTPFYQLHIQNKGRIVDFAGWALAIDYQSILKEAKKVRSDCGIFDASHMGEIVIKGDKALEFLQKLCSNDISLISKGQMQYNLFLSEQGGVIEDLMVYHLENSFMCVVNAANKEKVFSWLKVNLIDKVQLVDKSDSTALISLQGPSSEALMQIVFGKSMSDLEYMHFFKFNLDDSEIIISRSGYTGEDGFEIYLPWDKALFWCNKILDKGKPFELSLCGLGSRDILRVEAGYPLYGHEISEQTNPYEASLGWAVKTGKDFIGKDKILEAKNNDLNKKRIGFIMDDRAFPREDYRVYSETKDIGRVTSGVYSPNLDKFIGMASVDKNYADIDSKINIKVRDKFYKAEVVKFPFISPKTKRVKLRTQKTSYNEKTIGMS